MFYNWRQPLVQQSDTSKGPTELMFQGVVSFQSRYHSSLPRAHGRLVLTSSSLNQICIRCLTVTLFSTHNAFPLWRPSSSWEIITRKFRTFKRGFRTSHAFLSWII